MLHAEAPLEVMPRLFHLKYEGGLKEELLYLSDPQETETPSGFWITTISLQLPLCFAPRLKHCTVISCTLTQAKQRDVAAGRHLLTSTLAVEESVFETLRTKRYGRLVVLLTPAMKIISYDFNMLGYDYSVPQPVILNELGALMQQFQQYQHSAAQADATNGPKPHEVMQIAVDAIANLGHGFEGEVRLSCSRKLDSFAHPSSHAKSGLQANPLQLCMPCV